MEKFSTKLNSIIYSGDPQNSLRKLSKELINCDPDQAKSLLNFVKATIKSKSTKPSIKLQALKVLVSSMNSKNPNIINYCGKKVYNRFKIFGEYKKEVQDPRRGSSLFNASTKPEQTASEEFLILLLQSIKTWNDRFGIDSSGKQTNFYKLLHYLKSKNVNFPEESHENDKRELRNRLASIRRSVKKIMELISEEIQPEKITKIGTSLKASHELINNEIEKYMEMEDHALIIELNNALDLLVDAKSAYKAWKNILKRPKSESVHYILPSTCMFLPDLTPKTLPFVEELSDSIEEIKFDAESPCENQGNLEKDSETEREFMCSIELTGISAEYCIVKDRLLVAEQSLEVCYQEIRKTSEKNQVLKEKNKSRKREVEGLKARLEETREKVKDMESWDSKVQEKERMIEELQTKLDKAEEEKESLKKILERIIAESRDTENPEENFENRRKSTSNLLSPEKYRPESQLEIPQMPKLSLVSSSSDDKDYFTVSSMYDALDSEQTPLLFSADSSLSENYQSSFAIQEPIDQVDNFPQLKICMRKNHGVLFENSQVQVSISVKIQELKGKAKVTIKNKEDATISRVNAKIFMNEPEKFSMFIKNSKIQEIQTKSTQEIFLLFTCQEIFEPFPILKLSFVQNDVKTTLNLLLPIDYTLFCKVPQIDFISEWEGIEEFRETIVKSSVKSIKAIVKSLIFHRNFEYSLIQGNGVVIATESPIGLVLAKVVVRPEDISIQAKSTENRLRDLISSLIATQLVADN